MLQMVFMSRDSHDKVIYMIFFVLPAVLTKFEKFQYMVVTEILSLVLILCFACNPYPYWMAVFMKI